jgi:hypothetical protein
MAEGEPTAAAACSGDSGAIPWPEVAAPGEALYGDGEADASTAGRLPT